MSVQGRETIQHKNRRRRRARSLAQQIEYLETLGCAIGGIGSLGILFASHALGSLSVGLVLVGA